MAIIHHDADFGYPGWAKGPHRRVVDAASFAELGRRILDDDVRVI
jgi:hypothetical protein